MNIQKMSIITTIQNLHKRIAEKENREYNSHKHFNSLKTYEMNMLESFRDGAIKRYNKLIK